MKHFVLLSLLLIQFSGCALFQPVLKPMFRVPSPPMPGRMSDIRFDRTLEPSEEGPKQVSRLITVRFSGCNFRDGMRQLTELSGVPISWDKVLDDEVLDGVFMERELSDVLSFISRRYGVSVSENQGMYFLGKSQEGDVVSAVVRVPPVSRDELRTALTSFSEGGKVTIIGSFIWISDTLENVRRLVADLETIRERSSRSYLAEVFFITVNENDFLSLTADLRFNSVDVFSSSFNISQLFSMFVDADGRLGSTVIDTRPVLMLSEGRKATFEVGNEIVRERKAVNESGVISTTGYDRFQDGILLSLMLSRVSEVQYSVDLELEVSTFDKMDTSSVISLKATSVLYMPVV